MAPATLTPEEACELVEVVIGRLAEAGLDAAPLETVARTAYSSRQEWLGDLGLAALEVSSQAIADPVIQDDLERILRDVEHVWPAIRRQRNRVLPELRGRLLNNRLGALLWGVIAAGILGSAAVAVLWGGESWPFLALAGAIAAVFVWAASYMGSSVSWYRRMTYLARYVEPVPVRMELGIAAESALVATLRPLAPAPWRRVTVIVEDPSWDVWALAGSEVQARVDPLPGGSVIIETARGRIWPHERGRIERE